MSKEWFLECLADPYIFNSVRETIERIIYHFSDNKRQLIGVLWYNK